MRVVILGARGFVARALTDALRAAGTSVKAVPQDELNLLSPDAGGQLAALIQPGDAVVMPAALTPDKGRDVATLMKNLAMAESVCRALTASPCSHLVYISSDAVYPGSPDPMTEETVSSPTDLYSLMHVAREQMLGHAAGERGVPLCILRPCAIHGPGDTHNSYGPNRFLRTALSDGRIKLFGLGEEERDHVYIDDVVAVIRLALQRRTTGTINIVTGRAVSFRAVADCVARHAGVPVAIESAPRSGPVTHRHFNAARLHNTFPELTMTSLEDGIARTVATLRTSAV